MTKRPPRPKKSSRPDSSRSSHDAYAIGYRRPPLHTRFKPGQCGNPRGRPRRQRNVRTVVEEALNQRITIRQGDRTRSLTKLDGVILTMISAALKGDAKAQASLFTLLRSLGMTGEVPETGHAEPFTADDGAVIADYFQRLGSELQQSVGPEDKEDSTPTGTTRPDRRTGS
jgi:hypothetical protein